MEEKYSIWIVPPEEVKEILSKIIVPLGKVYDSPVFEPHMTLVGNILSSQVEIVKKTLRLAKKLKPFKISFAEKSFSTTYFQSVLVRITASAELMDAYIAARNVFDLPVEVFMPHMSLIYGNHSMSEREKICKEIKMPKIPDFLCNELVITPSTSDPKEWSHIKEVKLEGRSS